MVGNDEDGIERKLGVLCDLAEQDDGRSRFQGSAQVGVAATQAASFIVIAPDAGCDFTILIGSIR